MFSDFLDLFRQIKYGNLSYLWLALLVPALIALYAFAFKRKRRALEIFADPELLQHIVLAVSRRKQVLKAALLIACTFFLMLTLIEPKWGYHWEDVTRMGIDIIVAVDTSKSMLADDIKPNRLQTAKRRIEDLLRILDGDRIGLIAFAGTAFVQCPLTLDYGAFRLFLDDLSVDTIPRPGTNIPAAVYKAINAFEAREKKHKVLILITDGESHEGDIGEATKAAKKEHILVYTVGVGRRSGAYIRQKDAKGKRTTLKDREGAIVKSRLDEKALNKIALQTGGKYSRADSTEWPLERIYQEQIAKMEEKQLKSQRVRRYENRFQIPLFIALILLVSEAFVSERRRS